VNTLEETLSSDDWRELCEAIMNESDPEKLMDLVNELNRVLEEREKELRRNQRRDPREESPAGWTPEELLPN